MLPGDTGRATQFFWVSDELPGGDEHLPGDANQFWFNFDALDVLG